MTMQSQRMTPMQQYIYNHPRPSVTVDVVLFTYTKSELRTLLIQRGGPPYTDQWALPGGFVHMEEGLEEAAARELLEETGVGDVYLEQLYTFGDPQRDPRGRVITVVYFALLSADQAERLAVTGGDDAQAAAWWNVYDLPHLA
ncbi:MAG TPA: NUDIX hydrolase, partial [Caldilineaceae bacterium]|nr:NUDIX hydrolase [Caldilineaceae bacterium]